MTVDSSRLERSLGRVLGVGLILSTALLAVGLLLTLAGHATAAPLFLNAGLLTLMATPIVRVLVAMIDYVVNRDWMFLTLTASVLLVLLGSWLLT